jgi:general secretion pathway protein L
LNVLRIYFSDQWQDIASPCPWALCDESGTMLNQGISTLADMPASRDCLGIVSADRVLILTTLQPPGNRRRWQSALPFIAEEYTMTDPDDIHATPAASSQPGMITVSVIAKSWLKQIVAATNSAGLPLRRLIVESLLPNLQPDSWTLVWDGCNGFLRTSTTTGLALDCSTQQSPPLMLMQCLASAGEHMPRQIELRFAEPVSPAALPVWNLPIPLMEGEVWDWRCAPISDQTPNLLWGEFSPPIRLFDGLSKLRPALFILLAAFVIEVAGTHIEWLMLAREKSALTQNMEHIFHSTFGDDSVLVDAPLQTQRSLAALRHAAGVADGGDFLSLLEAATPSINKGELRGLNYESGRLGLDIKLANPAAVHLIEEKLRGSGLHVRTSDMHDSGDGTEAKLTLSQENLK